MLEWIVCRTKPNQEKRAARNLTRCGFPHFMPTCLDRHGVHYLFPNYVFVQVRDRQSSALRSLYGISTVIRRGRSVDICPDRVVDDLRARAGPDGHIRLADDAEAFAPGDTVRLDGGLFSGYYGLYEGMQTRDRVSVLLSLLGQQARVYVDQSRLEAAA